MRMTKREEGVFVRLDDLFKTLKYDSFTIEFESEKGPICKVNYVRKDGGSRMTVHTNAGAFGEHERATGKIGFLA